MFLKNLGWLFVSLLVGACGVDERQLTVASAGAGGGAVVADTGTDTGTTADRAAPSGGGSGTEASGGATPSGPPPTFVDASVTSDAALGTSMDASRDGSPGAPVDVSVDVPRGTMDAGPDASPVAMLTATPSMLDFGTVVRGQTVAAATIQIANAGDGATRALATALTGSAFQIGTDGCFTKVLMHGERCEITVVLSTAAAGAPTGRLAVTETAGDAVAIPLSANVVTPGALAMAPSTFDFGSPVIGEHMASPPFVVTNNGMTATGPLGVSLTGTSASEFATTDGCSGMALAAGGSCTIGVTLSPVSSGPKTASLAVSAMPGGSATASLMGRGLAPAALTLSPTTFAFGTVTVGQPAVTHNFIVSNAGDVASGALTTGLVLASGTQATEFATTLDGCSMQQVAGVSGCSITVQFKPLSFGSKGATLRINGGALTSSISGTGQDFVALTVIKAGSGGGTVLGDQINCGTTCSEQVSRTLTAPSVTLTAMADPGSRFAGWSGGGCSGSGPCTVTMSQAQNVTATFNAQATLTLASRVLGGQTATIVSSPAGISGSCSGTCTQSATFDVGTSVTLSVAGLAIGSLTRWSSTCTGATCAVTVNAAQSLRFGATTANIVFLTNPGHDANLGGVAGGDALCASTAQTAALPGNFVAFLGTSTTSAFSRLGAARGFIRPDGLPFGDTVASIQAGNMWYAPILDQFGTVYDANVMTGADMTGTCSDWTSNVANVNVTTGQSNGGGTFWDTGSGLPCSIAAPIYCFGTNFTPGAPPVLPLRTGRVAFVSRGQFVGSSGIAAADALCRTEATAAGLANPTRFLALLATTTSSSAARLNTGGPSWIRPDGVLLADTVDDFIRGNLNAPITLTADRMLASTEGVFSETWSGAPFVGVDPGAWLTTVSAPALCCNDWTSASSTATTGLIQAGDGKAYDFGNASCVATLPVICLEN